jgi:hypothetical protein
MPEYEEGSAKAWLICSDDFRIVYSFGSRGTIPIAFYSQEDAETYIRTCYSAERGARMRVVHEKEARERNLF